MAVLSEIDSGIQDFCIHPCVVLVKKSMARKEMLVTAGGALSALHPHYDEHGCQQIIRYRSRYSTQTLL
jgi:hypothetical protein